MANYRRVPAEVVGGIVLVAAHAEWDCDRCGTALDRWPGQTYVRCPECNASYNASGQRLADGWHRNPSNYDDEIGDLEGYEMAHADDY